MFRKAGTKRVGQEMVTKNEGIEKIFELLWNCIYKTLSLRIFGL